MKRLLTQLVTRNVHFNNPATNESCTMSQQQLEVQVALAQVALSETEPSEAESSAPADDASDSAGTPHGSEFDSVASVEAEEAEREAVPVQQHPPVLPFAVAAALQGTSLAAWARANAPEWLTPQQQEDYVALFLQAADIYQKWDDAEEGAGLTDLFDIDEEDEGYGGDAEDGAEAAASA